MIVLVLVPWGEQQQIEINLLCGQTAQGTMVSTVNFAVSVFFTSGTLPMKMKPLFMPLTLSSNHSGTEYQKVHQLELDNA